jgi:hypothetical protein
VPSSTEEGKEDSGDLKEPKDNSFSADNQEKEIKNKKINAINVESAHDDSDSNEDSSKNDDVGVQRLGQVKLRVRVRFKQITIA